MVTNRINSFVFFPTTLGLTALGLWFQQSACPLGQRHGSMDFFVRGDLRHQVLVASAITLGHLSLDHDVPEQGRKSIPLHIFFFYSGTPQMTKSSRRHGKSETTLTRLARRWKAIYIGKLTHLMSMKQSMAARKNFSQKI